MLGFGKKKPDSDTDPITKVQNIAQTESPEDIHQTMLASDQATRTVGGGVALYKQLQSLVQKMDPKGEIKVSNMLAAVGALAGYSCQESMRRHFSNTKGLSDGEIFTIVDTKDGKHYFYGDAINKAITECLWPQTEATVKKLGATQFLNMNEAFERLIDVVASGDYALHVPKPYLPPLSPDKYVTELWPKVLSTLELYTEKPLEWPIMFSFVIQASLENSAGMIDYGVAQILALESAVIASKLDLSSSL